MRALVKQEAGSGLVMSEVPEPEIGINDVLIRVDRTGICGTDLHIYDWNEWAEQHVPLPLVIEILQKVCHDTAALTCGGAPRFFPRESLVAGAELAELLRWSRELSRVAAEAEHPWIVDLGVESLVEQGRQALKTARSGQRPARTVSLNSSR